MRFDFPDLRDFGKTKIAKTEDVLDQMYRRVRQLSYSLWFGSPQSAIVAMRKFDMTQELRDLYYLPYGLDGDVEDPSHSAPSPDRTIRNAILGRNAASVYQIDVNAVLGALACDDVQKIRDEYIVDPLTPNEAASLRSNGAPGYRTRRELFKDLASKPWSP